MKRSREEGGTPCQLDTFVQFLDDRIPLEKKSEFTDIFMEMLATGWDESQWKIKTSTKLVQEELLSFEKRFTCTMKKLEHSPPQYTYKDVYELDGLCMSLALLKAARQRIHSVFTKPGEILHEGTQQPVDNKWKYLGQIGPNYTCELARREVDQAISGTNRDETIRTATATMLQTYKMMVHHLFLFVGLVQVPSPVRKVLKATVDVIVTAIRATIARHNCGPGPDRMESFARVFQAAKYKGVDSFSRLARVMYASNIAFGNADELAAAREYEMCHEQGRLQLVTAKKGEANFKLVGYRVAFAYAVIQYIGTQMLRTDADKFLGTVGRRFFFNTIKNRLIPLMYLLTDGLQRQPVVNADGEMFNGPPSPTDYTEHAERLLDLKMGFPLPWYARDIFKMLMAEPTVCELVSAFQSEFLTPLSSEHYGHVRRAFLIGVPRLVTVFFTLTWRVGLVAAGFSQNKWDALVQRFGKEHAVHYLEKVEEFPNDMSAADHQRWKQILTYTQALYTPYDKVRQPASPRESLFLPKPPGMADPDAMGNLGRDVCILDDLVRAPQECVHGPNRTADCMYNFQSSSSFFNEPVLTTGPAHLATIRVAEDPGRFYNDPRPKAYSKALCALPTTSRPKVSEIRVQGLSPPRNPYCDEGGFTEEEQRLIHNNARAIMDDDAELFLQMLQNLQEPVAQDEGNQLVMLGVTPPGSPEPADDF